MLADLDVVALAPASVALELPNGIAAVALAHPLDRLEAVVVSRKDDPSPAVRAFRDAAVAEFSGGDSVAPLGIERS